MRVLTKESTEIPEEIINKIITELNKKKVRNYKNLTLPYMKTVLKKLNLNRYYEHMSHIISKLSGLPPPCITREKEEMLEKMS